jgi:hypothetical protein
MILTWNYSMTVIVVLSWLISSRASSQLSTADGTNELLASCFSGRQFTSQNDFKKIVVKGGNHLVDVALLTSLLLWLSFSLLWFLF